MRKSFLLLALLLPVLSFGQWTIVGSDLLAPALSPTLNAYAVHNGLEIQTDFFGSVPGRDRLKNGEATMAILAAPSEADLPGGNFKTIPIAYEVAFIAVDKLNPVTEISTAQLAAIFGSSAKGNFTRWGDLGLQGPIASRSIQPLALDNDNTVVLELFKYRVLNSGSLKTQVNRVKSNLQVMELLSSDSGSIAITNRIILEDKIRALAISDESEFAFGPTPENVHYGEYPLRLSYYLVYPREKQEELKPLLRVLLGNDQADAFVKQGFVPLPKTVRERMVVELDKSN